MKKIAVTFSIILLISSSIFAQKINVDSLKKVVANNPVDTAKIKAYHKLASYYDNKNIDSSIYYAEKGIALAKSINNLKVEMILYQSYGIAYARKGDLQKALSIFQRGLFIAQKIKTRELVFMNNIAVVYSIWGKEDSASIYLQKVLKLSIEKDDKSMMEKAYSNIGNQKVQNNLYYTGISYYQKSLNILYLIKPKNKEEKEDIESGKADIHNNIGACFFELHNDEDALKNYKIALKIYEETEDSLGILRSYNNIGSLYLSVELDSAKVYIEKSIAIANSTNLKLELGTAFYHLGQYYFYKKNYDLALKYKEKAIDEYEKSGYEMLPRAYYSIAEIYIDINKLKLAEEYLNKSVNLTKNQVGLENIYNNYKKLYEKKGNSKKALHYSNLLAGVKDSLYNDNKFSLVQDLQTKYETEKKEADNVRLKTEIALQTAEVSALKSKQFLIIAIALLLVSILILIYFITRKRQTDRLNKLKFKELGRNNNKTARDLHDGIGGYHSALKMMLENKTGLTKEINIIDDAQKALRFQLQKLKAPDILDENFDFINEVKSFVNFMENTNPFEIKLEIGNYENWEKIRYELKAHLYNILKELLTNTMKYAVASEVNIDIDNKNNKLQFSYTDNGKGFDTNMQIKGEGINNIKQRAKQINAFVDFRSMENKGTKLDLNIPLKKSFNLLKKAV